MSNFDIIVIGEVCVDLLLSGNVEPEFGQVEKLINNATLSIGSSSAIFACGAAKLGLKVAFIGKIGDDIFGYFMRDNLEAKGIDVSQMIVDPKVKTGISVILSRGQDRAILTYLGSISELKFSEIDLSFLKQSRHLHIGSYFLQNQLQSDIPRLFSFAKENGLSTSLDTNYDPSEKWDSGLRDTFPYVDYFFPNENEIYAITKTKDKEDALDLLSKELNVIALKCGSNGAVVRNINKVFSTNALQVSVQDTTGAGDSFDAGFIYGILAGWNHEKALNFASICGSLSTRSLGGTNSQPDLTEALEYL